MHLRSLAAIALVIAAAAGCAPHDRVDAAAFSEPMKTYLAARGQLCLAKSVWPIDVTQHEIDVGGRNALQMPVLERLGLVSSTVAEVDVDDEGTLHHMEVRRFALTEAGRSSYIARVPSAATRRAAKADFCAARLMLDRVVGMELKPPQNGEPERAVVTYTYRVDAAPWTSDAEAQRVFPMVAGVIRGAGKAELQEAFVRTDAGWIAVDLEGK
ncbi:MAG TPA: hypothetical protein VII31_00905 [Caldimonas sp.]